MFEHLAERGLQSFYRFELLLDQMAEESGGDYLRNGSWEMLNNLSQMRERAQGINQGLDFFGFAPDYVPLQGYEQLLVLTEGPAGSTGLLGTDAGGGIALISGPGAPTAKS